MQWSLSTGSKHCNRLGAQRRPRARSVGFLQRQRAVVQRVALGACNLRSQLHGLLERQLAEQDAQDALGFLDRLIARQGGASDDEYKLALQSVGVFTEPRRRL